MSFYGYSFVFDDVPSETYGLVISSINSSLTKSSSGGSDIEIIKEKVKRKPNYFIQGVEQSTPLEFDLEFFSEKGELTRHTVSLIQKWLFGQMRYKKLRIIQNDLSEVYFNCILKQPELQTVGNLVYGFKCTVECDAPWAWAEDATYSTTVTTSKTINYYNSSDDAGYTYPTIYFKVSTAGNVSIKNITDNNNEMIFTGLLLNDDLTINTNLQIITTIQTVTPLSKFNFKWFRLVPGYNNILITGDLSAFTMTHKIARKVGS